MVDPTQSLETTAALAAQHPSTDTASGLEIRQLVGDHYRSVFRYAFRLTGSAADAEDITQQTFLVAQQKLHQVRDAGKADRWLFAVLRSCFLKSRRRQRPSPAAAIELNVDEIPDRVPAEDEIDRELLQAAIDELPDEFKLVVTMFYFEQLSYKEMATALEVPLGTVMSRLSRAKGRLRHRLLQAQGNPGSDGAARKESLAATASGSNPAHEQEGDEA